MAERNRPGDDATGDRPEDEVLSDVVEEDTEAPVTRGGGTATRERQAETSKQKARRVGVFAPIGRFVREVVSELRKVIWPTRRELLTYTAVVISFLVVMTAIVTVLDYGFAKGVLWAFGSGKK